MSWRHFGTPGTAYLRYSLTVSSNVYAVFPPRLSVRILGSLTRNNNFTSKKYLHPHSFTLPMVRCTVQKVGQTYVDFHGKRMCLYYTLTPGFYLFVLAPIPQFKGKRLKIGLLYQIKQYLVTEV